MSYKFTTKNNLVDLAPPIVALQNLKFLLATTDCMERQVVVPLLISIILASSSDL